MKAIVWYVFAGTRGGPKRTRIFHALDDRPRNADQLADDLDLNDGTVRHHLAVLTDNEILDSSENDNGAVYLPSNAAEDHKEIIEKISETH